MSDRDRHKPISGAAGAGESAPAADPARYAVYARPEVRHLLVALDIGGLYRVLGREGGLSQREIARRTGQSQSEVSEIVSGRRRVENHQVLRRICGGLEIPFELMGLSWWGPDGSYWGPDGTYSGEVAVADPWEGVEDDVLRRHMVALGGMAAFGARIPGVGALADPYPAPRELPLPSRLGMSHVAWIEEMAQRMWALRCAHGGQAEIASATLEQFTRWRGVEGPEAVRRALESALARAHEVAGLCCFDSGYDRHARNHYRQSLELAIEAGDYHRAASALRRSGQLEAMAGHPNSALKCYQLGQATLLRAPGNDPRTAVLAAGLEVSSAGSYARLKDHRQARACLARSRDGWEPPDSFQRADFDWTTADTVWRLGRLDDAEPFAASAARTFAAHERRDGVKARLTLATIHVQAADSRGLVLARQVIDEVAALHSVPTRQRLIPLAETLDTRPGSDAKELARNARQVATTRA
ncbi:MAG TPA: helix-turn-helix domain-containing protein [Pseudonocardiaceae bacterium]|jgi:transcriptional regulator with XRE-family HTH domain|nr:helix-turn-helix domain-containing protein [Pseudonocardiaceae bacterium]